MREWEGLAIVELHILDARAEHSGADEAQKVPQVVEIEPLREKFRQALQPFATEFRTPDAP